MVWSPKVGVLLNDKDICSKRRNQKNLVIKRLYTQKATVLTGGEYGQFNKKYGKLLSRWKCNFINSVTERFGLRVTTAGKILPAFVC